MLVRNLLARHVYFRCAVIDIYERYHERCYPCVKFGQGGHEVFMRCVCFGDWCVFTALTYRQESKCCGDIVLQSCGLYGHASDNDDRRLSLLDDINERISVRFVFEIVEFRLRPDISLVIQHNGHHGIFDTAMTICQGHDRGCIALLHRHIGVRSNIDSELQLHTTSLGHKLLCLALQMLLYPLRSRRDQVLGDCSFANLLPQSVPRTRDFAMVL